MANGIITEQTWSRDLDGAYKRNDVSSSFDTIEPDASAIQYTKNLKDHTYTINEQFIEAGGEGTWQVDCTVSQEPIETHKYFASMTDQDKRNWSLWKKDPTHPQLVPAGWDPLQSGSTQVQTLYYWWQRNVTEYLAPRIVLKWTVIEQHPPDCSQVGLIADGWNFPEIHKPASVNFLLNGANGRQMGSPEDGNPWYQNTYEFLGSSRSYQDKNETGWIQFLYGADQ